ncbi:DUF6141 family protein [Bacteroidales bacterium OttesenSCG-928-I21]|nr:DUF6141 family protein [Bacteroidales bacterium OttesenSCG-928-I21]
MKDEILYQEQQRVPWFWFVFITAINVPFFYGIIKQLIYKEPWGNNPMSDTGLIFVSAAILIFSGLILSTKLETIITKDGVYVRLFAFQRKFKFYAWDKIKNYHIKKYSPLRSYGGWGYKFGLKGSVSFSMRGNIGLELILNNGHKVIIGTIYPFEMEKALEKIQK